jgi:hypothetical protein
MRRRHTTGTRRNTGSEHVPRSEKTQGTMAAAHLTGAFEMGDPFFFVPRRRLDLQCIKTPVDG